MKRVPCARMVETSETVRQIQGIPVLLHHVLWLLCCSGFVLTLMHLSSQGSVDIMLDRPVLLGWLISLDEHRQLARSLCFHQTTRC